MPEKVDSKSDKEKSKRKTRTVWIMVIAALAIIVIVLLYRNAIESDLTNQPDKMFDVLYQNKTLTDEELVAALEQLKAIQKVDSEDSIGLWYKLKSMAGDYDGFQLETREYSNKIRYEISVIVYSLNEARTLIEQVTALLQSASEGVDSIGITLSQGLSPYQYINIDAENGLNTTVYDSSFLDVENMVDVSNIIPDFSALIEQTGINAALTCNEQSNLFRIDIVSGTAADALDYFDIVFSYLLEQNIDANVVVVQNSWVKIYASTTVIRKLYDRNTPQEALLPYFRAHLYVFYGFLRDSVMNYVTDLL